MRRALVAAIVLMLIIPPLAAAQSRQRDGEPVPSARVQAEGSGLISVAGRLAVNGFIPDRGTVVVKDRRGDARAYLAGEPLELRRYRATRVRRASGVLYVTGSNVTVTVIGNELSFSIAGNGRALFDGAGLFSVDGAEPLEWTGTWMRIPPSSTPERRRQRTCANCSSSVAPRR